MIESEKYVRPGRFDVHAHYLTGRYRREATEAGHGKPDGMPGLPLWSVEQALGAMDEFNVATAILSVSSPGVHFGNDQAARALARSVNDEASEAVTSHPERFGLFASLPLPDRDGALSELAYACETLHADGFVLMTNYHGIYLGDECFEPIFAELNRRGAVVFIHPTSPACPCCQNPSFDYPRPMVEFIFDTTRAITNLVLKGTLTRYPEIKIIVPHAGAAVPILVDRIVGLSPALGLDDPLDSDEVFRLLRNLYFDLAGFPIPRLLGALLQIADQKRILYGSDWPFTPAQLVKSLASKIDETDLLEDAVRSDIFWNNACNLLTRFRGSVRSP